MVVPRRWGMGGPSRSINAKRGGSAWMREGRGRRRSQGNEISGVEWRVYQGRGRLTVDGGILIGRRKHKEDEKRKEGRKPLLPFLCPPSTVHCTYYLCLLLRAFCVDRRGEGDPFVRSLPVLGRRRGGAPSCNNQSRERKRGERERGGKGAAREIHPPTSGMGAEEF